jgi:hypothetical protein
VSGAVTANGTVEDPKGHAEKVAHQIFPNMLPYIVGTPAVFGFAGWNGRSLTDNALKLIVLYPVVTCISQRKNSSSLAV